MNAVGKVLGKCRTTMPLLQGGTELGGQANNQVGKVRGASTPFCRILRLDG